MKALVLIGFMIVAALASQPLVAQTMDEDAVWPLCGRITENPPKGWQARKGCPARRFGNAAYSDEPLAATFGPRPLASGGNRYDFHRGIDISTPTGTPIFAVTAGNVETAGVDSSYSDPVIKLRHFRPGATSCSDGGGCYHTLYLHVSDWVVTEDEWVEKGQLIGYTGASGLTGYQHLHFEVRDAPAFDPFSSWQRDTLHPLGLLPYDAPNDTQLSIMSVEAGEGGLVAAAVEVNSNRYDLVSVDMTVFDADGGVVDQPGNTPDVRGYNVLPSFWDMETWNFQYTHKNSSAFPWSSYGAGGANECPYHEQHGASYSAHVHLDAQHPDSQYEGLFNGVHVLTSKYWLSDDRRYSVGLDFLALAGPAACVEAAAGFASGDVTVARWGECGLPNEDPVAIFDVQCTGLVCQFDGAGSDDPDGQIAAYAWDYGDGQGGSGVVTTHEYASPGVYSVTLTVTDNEGADASLTVDVDVQDTGSSTIELSLSTNKKRNRVAVNWSGAEGSRVDIWRNAELIATTANDGGWNDRGVSSGNTYAYRVCESGSEDRCSEDRIIEL